jgi:ABC-type dipeptide/oligopeptide/nickel transport system permease component
MTAGRYVIRRLLVLVPQVLGVTTIVFILIRLLPGDPAYLIAGSLATKDVIASIREQMGLARISHGV